jgi:hypothetical protein
MSSDLERIPVPTNGKGPHPVEAPVVLDAEPAPQAVPSVSPAQLAVGFGIVASLILLLVGWLRRGRSRRGRWPD